MTIIPRVVPVVVLLLAGLALGGCETIRSLADGMDKPQARVVGANLRDLTMDGATLAFDVNVANPYDVDLPLTDLAYRLASGGTPFLSGNADVAGMIPARGDRTITLPARVNFADLLGALSGVKPGAVVPYQADFDLSVDAPGVGPLSLPLKQEGEVPVPAVPRVRLENIAWQSLTLDDATAVLRLAVTNPNQFRVDLSALDLGLALADQSIVRTQVPNAASFSAGGRETVEIPISFAPRNAGLALFNLLAGSGSAYRLDGTMTLDTPFGRVDTPFRRTGETSFLH